MKRANEVLVGVVVLGAVTVAVAGSVYLSGSSSGRNDRFEQARFRTIGGLKAGDDVQLHGVKIGRVDAITLGDSNWVNVVLRLRGDARTPREDSVVAVIRSTTLFGDWGVDIASRADLPDDPAVRGQVAEARRAGSGAWPGATLPDIGQITAQASRIAGDIAKLSSRVDSTFDSTSVRRLQNSLRDFSILSRSLATIARRQQDQLDTIGANLLAGTSALRTGASAVAVAAARADSATDRAQLQRIFDHADSASVAMAEAAARLRRFSVTASGQDTALARLIANTDSILRRIQSGQGTLGRLTREDSLYAGALNAMNKLNRLLDDVAANPRRYFSFSVF